MTHSISGTYDGSNIRYGSHFLVAGSINSRPRYASSVGALAAPPRPSEYVANLLYRDICIKVVMIWSQTGYYGLFFLLG